MAVQDWIAEIGAHQIDPGDFNRVRLLRWADLLPGAGTSGGPYRAYIAGFDWASTRVAPPYFIGNYEPSYEIVIFPMKLQRKIAPPGFRIRKIFHHQKCWQGKKFI